MIHATRGGPFKHAAPAGRTHTEIDGTWVEWSGQQPSVEEVRIAHPLVTPTVLATQRALAKLALTDKGSSSKLARAIADAARDSDNAIRAWITSFKAAVAASGSLNDLKTRVAALDNMPAITTQQVLMAIANRIDDGSVDG